MLESHLLPVVLGGISARFKRIIILSHQQSEATLLCGGKTLISKNACGRLLTVCVPVIVVSKRLGHAKVSITMDIYGHLIPETQSGVGQLMDDLIAPIELQITPSCTTFEFVEKEE